MQQSSPRTVNSPHHPSAEPGSSKTHPGTSILPGTYTSLPSSTIPVPVVIHQPPNASTHVSHPVSASHSLDGKQGGNTASEQAVAESELSSKDKDDDMNQKILRAVRNLGIASQDHTPHVRESEMNGNDDSRVDVEAMASNQYKKSPSGSTQHQLESEKNRDGRMMSDLSNGEHNLEIDSGRFVTKIKGSMPKTHIDMSSKGNDSVASYSSSSSRKKQKQKQTAATQVNHEILGLSLSNVKKAAVEQEFESPSSADPVAMRVEFSDSKSGIVIDEWNKSNIEYTSGINGKKNPLVSEDTQQEKEILSKEVSLKTSKSQEIHTPQEDQRFTEGNLHEPIQESCPSKTTSEGSGASQSPSAILSHHTTPSSSSQSPSENLRESYLPQQSPSLLSKLPQEDASTPSQLPHQSQPHQQIPTYYESQSSGSQSPEIQSPPSKSPLSKSPQESHSPKRIEVPPSQSPQKVKSPQNWSSKETHLQRSQLRQRTKSPQKQSPKKSRSLKKELPVLQGSEVSETDDEKMRNLSLWLHGRARGRASTPSSSSSVSISEHLQKSHSSWTKNQGHRKEGRAEAGREAEEEVEELPGGSEIDLSDLEDLSLSGLTLTNTSVLEDIHTPGDEDF